jgi:hypothetical protein
MRAHGKLVTHAFAELAMYPMFTSALLSLLLLFSIPEASAAASASAIDWRTPAEISGYTRTPRYAQTRAYFERLDQASAHAQLLEFGTTPEGRKQFAVVMASGGEFTPELAARSGKPVLWLQACIHAGENEGKDALMALSREWLIEGKQKAALDKVIVMLIPIFNVDGHERFGPHHRINQNGPAEMGWRATGQNFNLNRDFIKAETPEMRAWLRLWQAWNPALLVDMHNTDGADYQYHLLYHYETGISAAPEIDAWQKRTWLGEVVPAVEQAGFLLAPYLDMKAADDISAGLQHNASSPRYSAGFGPAVNRPALLLETHMIKDFKTRTLVNQAFVRAMIASIGAAPEHLQGALAKADSDARASKAGDKMVLAVSLSEASKPFAFKGYESSKTLSEISGGVWTRYDQSKPITFDVPLQDQLQPALEISLPAAYVVPRSWTRAINKLKLHGVQMQTLQQELSLSDAQTYRFKNLTYAPQPFEGRVRIATIDATQTTEAMQFPAGSVLIRINQPRAKLIAHLLEPMAPDSLLRNGDADSFLTRTEYAEARVLEAKARALLQGNAALAAEFQSKLQDPVFAGSAGARLNFFYEKLPNYDQRYLRYPVARLSAAQLANIAP